MGSTFAGKTLFDSGPHRFTFGRVGRLTRGPFQTALEVPYTTDEGERELRVIQRGRLVAPTTALLWFQVDAIEAEARSIATGTLVDHHGRAWTGLSLLRFEPLGPVGRGREVSLGYEVLYLRLGG